MNKIQLILPEDLIPEFKDIFTTLLSNSTQIEIKKSKSQDRSLEEIINLIFHQDIAKNLIATAIWELCRFIWSKQSEKKKSKQQKEPHLLVKMKDGQKKIYPHNEGKDEFCRKISELPFDQIEFIRPK